MEITKKMPKVSVVIPCYNVEKYLPNCFKSLQNQTYENLEIIFVNDGSKDNALDVIKNFCEKKQGFVSDNVELKYIDQQNGGLSNARNNGIKAATGDYVYFYDPDDMLYPDIIKTLVGLLRDAEMAVCSFKKVPDGKNYDEYNFSKKKCKIKEFNKVEATEQYLSQKLFDFCVWNKIYDLKILKENNIYFLEQCRYGEDTYFNYLYLKHVKKLVYTSQELYLYVQRANSLVHSAFNERRLHAFYCLNKNILDSKENFDEVERYAYALRTMVSVEMIYFIYKSDYKNVTVINKILEYMKIGIPYLKKCKRIAGYRRSLIPLVPSLARKLLKKRIKNGDKEAQLPESMTLL